MKKQFHLISYLALFFAFLFTPLLSAEVWNVDNDGTWAEATNWNPQTVPDSVTAAADLTTNSFGANISIDLVATGRTVNQLNFDSNTLYTVASSGGGALTLGGAAPQIQITTTNGSPVHILSAPVSLGADLIISTDNPNGFTVSGIISGAQNINLTGTAQQPITFSGSNSFTGAYALSDVQMNLATGAATVSNNISTQGTNTSSNLIFDVSSALEYSGVISSATGTIAVTKNGAESLTLSGDNTYTGALTISNGSVVITADAGLPNVAVSIESGNTLELQTTDVTVPFNTISVSGGSLNVTSGNPTLNTTITLNAQNGTFQVGDGLDLTLSGQVTGAGALIKTGTGTLTLTDATNNYGDTEIQNGTLVISNSGHLGTGAVNFSGGELNNSGNLILTNTIALSGTGGTFSSDGADSLTLQGAITGAASTTITKTGDGILLLDVANPDFSGLTTINAGTLTLNTAASTLGSDPYVFVSANGTLNITNGVGSKTITTLGGSGVIALNNNTFIISSGDFSGDLTGVDGSLTKNSIGSLVLRGNNTYSGATTVNAGELQIEGSLNSEVTVNTGATLSGSGSLVSVTNSGTVSPGSSIGTLTVVGTFTQTADGNLDIEVNNAGQSDLIDITGNAVLDGTVTVIPLSSNITPTTQYEFLRTTTGYGNTRFSGITSSNSRFRFKLLYQGDSVFIVALASRATLPIPISQLRWNAKRTADYLFNAPATDNKLINLQNQLSLTPASTFSQDLVELSPVNFGGLMLSSYQNNLHMADSISQKTQNTMCACHNTELDAPPLFYWVDPIGFLYKQNLYQDVSGFNLYTYGTSAGVGVPFSDASYAAVAAGYTRSNLFWKNRLGRANSNTVYVGPSIGISTEFAYMALLVQGSIDFYEVKRHIQFSNINTTAENRHKSYNVLCRADLGAKLNAGEHDDVFIEPQLSFNYVNLFQESFSEKGATDFINLSVKHKHSVIVQPTGGFKIIKEISKSNYCFAPNIYIGWLANVPITSGDYVSHFYQMQVPNLTEFTVVSFDQTTNQLVLGAEFIAKNCAKFKFRAGYRAEILSHFQIHTVYVRLNLNF